MVEHPLDEGEIRELAGRVGGVGDLVSRRSPAYRIHREAGLTDDDPRWFAILAREPRLVRRPILETDRGVAVGFDPDRWAALLAGE
ncbi:MAG: arsenate reductase [Actinomycetia bacterium]|nr:arsenate reductase [Actinomycetes bacterium]